MDVRDAEPSRVRLEAGEVHLWWGRGDVQDQDWDALLGSLSDEERRRGESFRRAEHARAFLFRRAFRRAVLARYAGVAPGELAFEEREHGKPFLAPPHERVRFNASSTGGWVLVAVAARREVGVDVERADERFLEPEELSRLARRVLTPGEQAVLANLPARARPRAFLRAWTRKEALLKALGTGLSREPNTVEVGLEPHAGEQVLDARLCPGRLLDLQAPSECSASVVVAAEPHEELVWEHKLLQPGTPGSSLARPRSSR